MCSTVNAAIFSVCIWGKIRTKCLHHLSFRSPGRNEQLSFVYFAICCQSGRSLQLKFARPRQTTVSRHKLLFWSESSVAERNCPFPQLYCLIDQSDSFFLVSSKMIGRLVNKFAGNVQIRIEEIWQPLLCRSGTGDWCKDTLYPTYVL